MYEGKNKEVKEKSNKGEIVIRRHLRRINRGIQEKNKTSVFFCDPVRKSEDGLNKDGYEFRVTQVENT